MTFCVFTESHGYVDCGFYGAFMKLSRIGKYAFETRDFCDLTKSLAENSELVEAKISGVDEEKFWELEEKEKSEYISRRISSILNKSEEEIREFVRENARLSIEDKVKLMGSRIEVPVEIDKPGEIVKIGEYVFENSQFMQLTGYILNGGHFGWRETPDFVKSADAAIKHSKNSLYESLRH